jgi:hypothetical protein
MTNNEPVKEEPVKVLPRRKRWIPFGILPAHWGTEGDSRELLKAEFYYEGSALKRVKAKIGITDPNEIKLIDAELDFSLGEISRFEYRKLTNEIKLERSIAALEVKRVKGFISEKIYNTELEELQLNFKIDDLEVNKDEGLMTEHEFEKEKANLKDEKWVAVVAIDMDEANPQQGDFEIDWNDKWVEYLSENGYKGASDEDIVNTWFNDVCKTVLIQEASDQDWGMEERKLDINKRDDVEIIRDSVMTEEENDRSNPKVSPDETK